MRSTSNCPSMDFEAFYAASVNAVLATARRTADSQHLAWDATQEAYTRMLERWPDRRLCCFTDNRRYTVAIAVNLIIDAYRQRKRNAQLDNELEYEVEDSALAEVYDETDLLRSVRTFIERQPIRRRAVGMPLIEGMQTAEIASALSMKESTVRTHVQRLRILLKPYVDQIIGTEQGDERP